MDINTILNEILKLRQQSPNKLGEYLFSAFSDAGLNVQRQSFFSSTKTEVLVGLVVSLLSGLLLIAALKRKSLITIGAAFAIPLILFLELSVNIPVVSWPVLKKSENIIVQFPVQNASEKMIIGTPYAPVREVEKTSSRFEATISAFLLPAALVTFAVGLWQLVVHFGKFTSEDVRTITVVIGLVCMTYFGIWTGTAIKESGAAKYIQDPQYNADSVAMLTALALQRNDRLAHTWVTIAFFGGQDSRGVEKFGRQLSRRRNRIDTAFIECREVGRKGDIAFVVPLEEREDSIAAKGLVQLLAGSALTVTGRPPEIFPKDTSEDMDFGQNGISSIELTSISPGEKPADLDKADKYEIEHAQLPRVQQVLENLLQTIDAEQMRRHLPVPPKESGKASDQG